MQETFLARLEGLLKSWRTPPVYASVFGSAARGDMAISSDIDLLLVRPHAATDAEWQEQLDDLVATVTRLRRGKFDVRTKPCSGAIAQGRLNKANQFIMAAETIRDIAESASGPHAH